MYLQTEGLVIPQFEPYWDDKEKLAVLDVLNSNYLLENKITRSFESEFAKFVGAKFAVTCTSGTMAIYLALMTAKNQLYSNSVFIPDFNGIFVNNASIQAGLRPRLSDVNELGLMSGDGDGFVVHSNGRIGETTIWEDCAQSIQHHTQHRISTFSFASSKHITTCTGQGGMVCVDSNELYDKLTRLKDHGRTDRQNLKPMSDNYEHWGINAKFGEAQAAFALEQLKKLPARLERLKDMYNFVKDHLSSSDKIKFIPGIPKWYIDIIVETPQKLIDYLDKNNIKAKRFPKPLHKQPIYSHANFGINDFIHSDALWNYGVYLPSTTNLTDEQLHYICDKVKEFLRSER